MNFLYLVAAAHNTPVEKLAHFSDAGTKREGSSFKGRVQPESGDLRICAQAPVSRSAKPGPPQGWPA